MTGRHAPAVERFWAKVDATGDCWLWTGATTKGYGQFRVGDTMVYAHRYSYELAAGVAPQGQVDHLCKNTLCVRPTHLEDVSQRENIARSSVGAHNAAKTRCPAGHPYSAENTGRTGAGGRYCRTCKTEKSRTRRAR